jgi:FMN phosphatase YigB (HAD superfamily)
MQQAKDPILPKDIPPLPKTDGRWLFNNMMTNSVSPDPWMYPALKNLKASDKYMIAAVSNTVIFPPGHSLYRPDFFGDPIRILFDVFVSSAHVRLRKPDPKMYEYTFNEVNLYAKAHANSKKGKALGWADGIKPEEVVFLDDIGENLKGGKAIGFRTIKVPLGKAFEAVDELENITGLKLAGDHPRVPIKPKLGGSKANL